jgi:putative hemolysin
LLQLGRVEVRLASSEADVGRRRHFATRFSSRNWARVRCRLDHAALDVDDYDALCDHLLAIHHGPDGSSA